MIYNETMQRLQSWLLATLIVLWPSNLFLKFAENTGYLHGLLVDYLLPKLYLTDFIIFAIFLSWIGERLITGKSGSATSRSKVPRAAMLVGALMLIILAALQIQTAKPLAAFWFLAKVVEMVLLASWLATHRDLLKKKLLLGAVIVMLGLQSLIGITQFFKQSSVFPSYEWFGESRLEHRAGLARGTFENVEYILPYGTTQHPNVLAAVLVIGLLVLWTSLRARQHQHAERWLEVAAYLSIILSLITLGLTQSWTAWISLIGGVVVVLLYTKLQSHRHAEELGRAILAGVFTVIVVVPFWIHQLAQTFPDNTSIDRRDNLNQSAFTLWQKFPLTGVGLNQFTAELEAVAASSETVRFVQPAHHVGLLILAEVGVVGIVLALAAIRALYRPLTARQRKQVWSTVPCVALILLPMFTLDHYLWTQHIGQLSVVIGGVWLASTLSLKDPG